MLDLDELDRKLLYFLDHDGRIPYSDLARKVRHGRDIVEYRVTRLIDRGIIKAFRAVLNPARFGLTLHKTYVRHSASEKEVNKYLHTIKSRSRVFWIVKCHGQWDLIISIAARSAFEFHKLQASILEGLSSKMIAWQVYPVAAFKIYRMKYLHAAGTHWHEIGGSPDPAPIDDLERRILKHVADHGRDPIAHIARRLETSPAMVESRLARLQKEKIIVGYQAEIDLQVLGVTRFKAQLFLNSLGREEEDKLESYCNSHPLVCCYIWQVGDCRSEIEVQVSSYSEYNQFIQTLRERFPQLIRNVTSLLMHTDFYKWDMTD